MTLFASVVSSCNLCVRNLDGERHFSSPCVSPQNVGNFSAGDAKDPEPRVLRFQPVQVCQRRLECLGSGVLGVFPIR